MHLIVKDYGATCVLSVVTPRFNEAVAREIREEGEAAIRPKISAYLVDLGRVTYIDSSAIGVLVGLMKRIGRYGRLELCGPRPTVQKVLRMTHMDGVFTIHRDVAAGLDANFAPRSRAG